MGNLILHFYLSLKAHFILHWTGSQIRLKIIHFMWLCWMFLFTPNAPASQYETPFLISFYRRALTATDSNLVKPRHKELKRKNACPIFSSSLFLSVFLSVSLTISLSVFLSSLPSLKLNISNSPFSFPQSTLITHLNVMRKNVLNQLLKSSWFLSCYWASLKAHTHARMHLHALAPCSLHLLQLFCVLPFCPPKSFCTLKPSSYPSSCRQAPESSQPTEIFSLFVSLAVFISVPCILAWN